MSYRAILDDPGSLAVATDEALLDATVAIVARLGDDWKAGTLDSKAKGIRVTHRSTKVEFVAIPGGTLAMGLSEDDIKDASAYIDWTSGVAEWTAAMAERARPVHSVRVQPFLFARKALTPLQIERFTGRPGPTDACDRATAVQVTRRAGLRLPSEGEFEWVVREGGSTHFVLDAARRTKGDRWSARLRSCWGLNDLTEAQWMADDWHPTYDGAPSSAIPWMGGQPCGVQRGVQRAGCAIPFMQDSEELLSALAAARFPGGEPCRIRLALDMP